MSVGHEPVGGVRLGWGSGLLGFEGARAADRESVLPIRHPRPLAPHTSSRPATPRKAYQLLQHSNRFLRAHHPHIDLPKTLLLKHILTTNNTQPPQQQAITGTTLTNTHDLIISSSGKLTNELRHHAPAATLPTPILQLSTGPALSQDGNALILARTHDATTLFTYAAGTLHTLHRLTTAATGHETHLDSCLGHARDDQRHQLIALDVRGHLHRLAGTTLRALGHLPTPGRLEWARCAIYPSNDCVVVGLRNALSIVDPRIDAPSSTLYVPDPGHQITDVQRYISNRTPHLRLLSTTAQLAWIDDRRPGRPVLADYISAPALPPRIAGFPAAVRLAPSAPRHNPRAGLVFFRRPGTDDLPERLSVVEATPDGQLSHHQLGIFPADTNIDWKFSQTGLGQPASPLAPAEDPGGPALAAVLARVLPAPAGLPEPEEQAWSAEARPAVARVLQEWPLGAAVARYPWPDLCAPPPPASSSPGDPGPLLSQPTTPTPRPPPILQPGSVPRASGNRPVASQPLPRRSPSPSLGGPGTSGSASQIVPGPHAARGPATTPGHPRKKKRVGGF
ncbi:hypothetical protein PtB15_15B251 [Puccinia triticina]|nr:hypothetical protein PtB15_15B251 [Puccinia triticina]